MEVTVAIINYNYGRFLQQTIESALNQSTDIDFEVLVIDDGSTDNSDEIVKLYLSKTNFRVSKSRNQGFGKSLVRAIQEAKGKYVFLLDADDYFAPDKIDKVVPFLKAGYLYVCDTSKYINVDGHEIRGGTHGSTSTVAVKRSAAIGLLPVENELSFYTLYLLGRGKILTERYTYYRVHNSSMTNRSVPGAQQKYLAGVRHNLCDQLSELSISDIPDEWKVSETDIKKVVWHFKSEAYYNELEASLELGQRSLSFKNYKMMILWALKYKKKISIFHLKMLVRIFLMLPSFPKKYQNNSASTIH